MALFTARILPNINKKLQMMRKSCVGTQTKRGDRNERRSRTNSIYYKR
jgi:hypothetical protein